MDSITLAEMLSLHTLNASGFGISNLNGLQFATNLTGINLANNNLTNIGLLLSLSNPPAIAWGGNPGFKQVPALPPLGQLLLALGLFAIMTYFRRSKAC